MERHRGPSQELTVCARLWCWSSVPSARLESFTLRMLPASLKVKVVGVFPADSYPPVVYPAALVKGKDTPAVRHLLEFLKIPRSQNHL